MAAMFTKEQEHLEELRFHNGDPGLNEVTGRLKKSKEKKRKRKSQNLYFYSGPNPSLYIIVGQ